MLIPYVKNYKSLPLFIQKLTKEITLKMQPECLWQFQIPTLTDIKIVRCDNLPGQNLLKACGTIWIQRCHVACFQVLNI